MAFDEKGQWVTLHYEVDGVGDYAGQKVAHGLRMKLGTAQALGFDKDDVSVGFKVTNVAAHSVTRRLYPGGPLRDYQVSAKNRAVSVGPSSGRARTNKKLILKGNGPNKMATIYFSGPQWAAVKFLKDKTNVDGTLFGNGMQLLSSRGKPLLVKSGLLG